MTTRTKWLVVVIALAGMCVITLALIVPGLPAAWGGQTWAMDEVVAAFRIADLELYELSAMAPDDYDGAPQVAQAGIRSSYGLRSVASVRTSRMPK